MSNVSLRSQGWFGRTGKDGFIYRAWMKNQGIPDEEFRGKPVIGICNTWSELTPCNAHFRELAESVKKNPNLKLLIDTGAEANLVRKIYFSPIVSFIP